MDTEASVAEEGDHLEIHLNGATLKLQRSQVVLLKPMGMVWDLLQDTSEVGSGKMFSDIPQLDLTHIEHSVFLMALQYSKIMQLPELSHSSEKPSSGAGQAAPSAPSISVGHGNQILGPPSPKPGTHSIVSTAKWKKREEWLLEAEPFLNRLLVFAFYVEYQDLMRTLILRHQKRIQENTLDDLGKMYQLGTPLGKQVASDTLHSMFGVASSEYIRI